MQTKQVKSRERVAKHGEVFTNPREVNAMLDLVQDQITRMDATFLEPACGSGNFLVEILRRRMAYLNQKYKTSLIQYQPATVQAVCGLYGIELLNDNAAECRERLLATFAQHYLPPFQAAEDYPRLLDAVRRVLAKNIVCGDALNYRDSDGLPIVFIQWQFSPKPGGTIPIFVMPKAYEFQDTVQTKGGEHSDANLFAERQTADNGQIPRIVKPLKIFPRTHYFEIGNETV